MSLVNRVKSIANVRIDEVDATIRFSTASKSIIVSNAAMLYSVFPMDPQRQILKTALNDHRKTDGSMLLRGLIVQLNGVFQNFVRSLCVAVVENKSAKASTYSSIDEQLRKEYLHRSAVILTHRKNGKVNGLAFDFDTLQTNLAKCLLDKSDYKIQSDVFTLLMGNCDSARLIDLFRALSLGDPFGDDLGRNQKLKAWAKDSSARKVSNKAKSQLDDNISLRNEMAHGNLTKAVSESDVKSCAEFFRALIDALSEKVTAELKSA